MQQRKLGNCGLAVSAIGFGCAGLSTPPRRTVLSRGQQIAMIRAARDFGVTYFDTAGAEANGEAVQANEALLADAIVPLQKTRQPVVIATSFGAADNPLQIRQAGDASLKRLNVEAIDLFYPHHLAPQLPIEDVAGAVQDLIRQGKVKHFGLSEASAATIRRAHAVQPVRVLQAEYSLWVRKPEHNGVLQAAEELGIGFIARSPLGRGLLGDVFCGSALEKIAKRKYATHAQIALAWLLAQKPWIVPMPSTQRIGHLDENLGGADVSLSAEDLCALDAERTPAIA